MHILLWLVPPVAVTAIAMLWAAWAGRPRREQAGGDRRTDADNQRLARALGRPLPGTGRGIAPARRDRDRSTGIAVRPSRGAPAHDAPWLPR
ncbi:MAG: hypothetical protein ACRDPB_05570, partial [Nocardioidaceae bacterium]